MAGIIAGSTPGVERRRWVGLRGRCRNWEAHGSVLAYRRERKEHRQPQIVECQGTDKGLSRLDEAALWPRWFGSCAVWRRVPQRGFVARQSRLEIGAVP